MTDSLYYSCHHFDQINHIQSCVEPILDNLIYVTQYQDLLTCHNKILMVDPWQANGEFEITKQLIKQNNYIIVVNYGDGYNEPSFTALRADLPEIKKFACITGDATTELSDAQVNLQWFYFRTLTRQNIFRAKEFTTSQIYKNKNKPYKFLYLNGAARPHRVKLWQHLQNTGLISQSLCSFLGYGNFKNNIPLTYLPSEYDSYLTNTDANTSDNDYNKFKFNLWNRHWVDGDIIPKQYIDTYFSLVTETCFDSVGSMPTEKIYKPLLAGHPFIALANPGFYRNLQSLGFKTFDGLIDESFDHEEDPDRRIEMVANEVQKLCSSNLKHFLDQTKEICLYNQKHYIENDAILFKKVHYDLIDFFTKVELDAMKYFNSK